MSKEIPLRISTFLDQSAINLYLDTMPRVPSAPIKIALYAMDERFSFDEIFKDWKPQDFEQTKLDKITQTDKYTLYKVDITLPDDKLICPNCNKEFCKKEAIKEKNKELVYFLSINELPLCMVLSNTHVKEADYAFSFFDKYYPFLTRTHLRSSQLKAILTEVQEKNIFGEEVIATDFILKRFSEDKVTERHFKKRDFKSIFYEAKNNGLWLDNITFKVEGRGRIQLSRDGKLQYYEDFVFSDMLQLIDLIVQSGVESYELVKTTKDQTEKGIQSMMKIQFDEPIFTDVENSDFFFDYLKDYKEADMSIMSRNGAFFELSVLDYNTGSSFDICAYTDKNILIIPQYQVTTISLIRLVNYILEEYDGKIER